MPQIDKFIEALVERGAEALTLTPGEPICLVMDGQPKALIKEGLTSSQVTSLIQEIAPADSLARAQGGERVTFSYDSPAGSVTGTIEAGEGGIVVRLSTQGSSEASPAGSLATDAATPGASADPIAENSPETSEAPAAPVSPPAPETAEAAPAPAADTAAPSPAPAVADPEARKAMDALLSRLVEADGSDLHLRVGETPILRLHGSIVRDPGDALEADHVQSMLESIMPERDRLQHLETGDADFAYELEGVARFRVNAAMERGGPMAVMRVIPSAIPTCEQMGLTPEVEDLCMLTKGLVLVTGPTGSGKSTTLAALIDKINAERDDHILTIEDPIEFVHKSKRCLVSHRQVGQHTQSFQTGLRAALREDPDVVLIGELRDLETIAIAIETAETGHLVFGTLHTTTAASTVDRIIDQFAPDRQAQIRVMLSESLRAVISQTLPRKVGGGRVPAREILLTTPAISNLIREGKTFQIPSIMQTSRKLGMVTMTEALIELVEEGVVEAQEAYTKAVDKISIRTALQARGLDTSFLASAS